MNFINRPLNTEECELLDLEKFGVSVERRPTSSTWCWAIDESNGIYFTQLISSGGAYGEMREGWYWYILVINSHPVFIRLTGGSTLMHDIKLADAQFMDCGAIHKYDRKELIIIANNAAIVHCYDKKPFHFLDKLREVSIPPTQIYFL